MELTTFQIILILGIIIIAPLGFFNMVKMKRKKMEEEMFGDESLYEDNLTSTYSSVNIETEEKVRAYIEQYRVSYPKESIEKSILAFNITSEQAKSLVDKYF